MGGCNNRGRSRRDALPYSERRCSLLLTCSNGRYVNSINTCSIRLRKGHLLGNGAGLKRRRNSSCRDNTTRHDSATCYRDGH